jgi:hypothetical protein
MTIHRSSYTISARYSCHIVNGTWIFFDKLFRHSHAKFREIASSRSLVVLCGQRDTTNLVIANFTFMWPCIVRKVREEPPRCHKSWSFIHFLKLNMFRAPLCPSSGVRACGRLLKMGTMLPIFRSASLWKTPEDGRNGARNMLSLRKWIKLQLLWHLGGSSLTSSPSNLFPQFRRLAVVLTNCKMTL